MDGQQDAAGAAHVPMGAPWAPASAADMSPEDQQRLLQEKLARARAMKPGAGPSQLAPINTGSPDKMRSTPSPQRVPSSPGTPGGLGPRPPSSPGLVVAPWAAADMSDMSLDRRGQDSGVVAEDVPATVIMVRGANKSYKFRPPTKVIKSPELLLRFQKSESYASLKSFVLSLNSACKGIPLSQEVPVSPSCQAVISILHTASAWVEEIPPIQQPMRYGNKAFRDWIDKCRAEVPRLVEEMLPPSLKPAAVEIAPYLQDSFGNKDRIDYGTGHEHTFVTFLACLADIGFFDESDMQGIALRVFWEYLKVARKLQLVYRLEPAGSHGCWSLDDYQFIPFMWGSSQLIDHPDITPNHIHDLRAVKAGADDWFYLHCIKFIHEVKSGQLAENSPMLNDISGSPSWERINNGMLRMYFAEVMDKLPVIQHMLFGSIFEFS